MSHRSAGADPGPNDLRNGRMSVTEAPSTAASASDVRPTPAASSPSPRSGTAISLRRRSVLMAGRRAPRGTPQAGARDHGDSTDVSPVPASPGQWRTRTAGPTALAPSLL